MAGLTLVIGNKNYSSWSLRPWLLMKVNDIAFAEERIALYQPNSKDALLQRSPAGLVPVLKQDSLLIWDSLAIMEYLAEAFPAIHAWPADKAARARARSISAEMHSGFSTLRQLMPMNCRKVAVHVDITEALAADIERVQDIWQSCLECHDGPFLFNQFSIADAMYAPVVTRFKTYGVAPRNARIKRYQEQILSLHAMRQWYEDARAENEVIEGSER
ncbi:glutathione S-transferase family protein [Bowmanella denitrificans]|uniref:glutathione S-transferase family protein n=1 Tax=Bowmanella denitrificans TaxID=366582 RepID=UPI000C9A8B67|nr:glutathione S-transferase family protein [Bowmanella denitrificans]